MSAGDLDVARRFLEAWKTAARTGDRDALFPLLAADVEWATPQRDLRGIDVVHDQLTWLKPRDTLDVEFDEPDLTDHGGGRIVVAVQETYRIKGTGDFAYARNRRIELTISDRKIARYELQFAG